MRKTGTEPGSWPQRGRNGAQNLVESARTSLSRQCPRVRRLQGRQLVTWGWWWPVPGAGPQLPAQGPGFLQLHLQRVGAASLETPRSMNRRSLLHWASLMAQTIKNLPTVRENQVRSLGREDPLPHPREGNGNPLQYSCLKNSRDRLAGYSPQDCNKLDTTERLSLQPALLVSVL